MGGPGMGMGSSQTLGAAPAGGMGMGSSATLGAGPAMGPQPGMGGPGPAMGGPGMGGPAGQPTMGVAPARPAGSEPAIPGLGPLRRLLQALGGALSDSNKRKAQVEEPAPSEEDPSAFTGLLLPTTYQAKIDSVSGGAGIAAATGMGRFPCWKEWKLVPA